jgi:hypothetical protein
VGHISTKLLLEILPLEPAQRVTVVVMKPKEWVVLVQKVKLAAIVWVHLPI